MAGIGFEFRRLLRKNTFSGMLGAYFYAGMISSGPWVVSILAMLMVHVLAVLSGLPGNTPAAFMVTVTNLIAHSLIVSGLLQLVLTRYASDQLAENHEEKIGGALTGAMLISGLLAAAYAGTMIMLFFKDTTLTYRITVFASFVTLCEIWLLSVLLTGLKRYGYVVISYIAGYGLTAACVLPLEGSGLDGLMAGFAAGQGVLMTLLLGGLLRHYGAGKFVSLDVFRAARSYPQLIYSGLLYNLAIWIDKLMFWLNPATSQAVAGPFRTSPLYDPPLFLAYLAILPGMAVYVVEVETDFSEAYDAFFSAVRDGKTLAEISEAREDMESAIKRGLSNMAQVQTVTVAGLMLFSPHIFKLLGLSTVFLPTFLADSIGASLQLFFMVLLNYLFYLDRRAETAGLITGFLVLNVVFTALTQWLGPDYYGYGFAAALFVCSLAALPMLSRVVENLEYYTFMHQEG
jgi:uncharacterized membrane protein